MPIPWQSSADEFVRILRTRGVEPGAVCDVEAVWDAFCEFLQVGVDGIEGPESDGDGFIVQWGRWDWNGNRPAMSFGRQLAVSAGHRSDDPEWQPEYWQVEVQLVFEEGPGWVDLDRLGHQDTGFDFEEIGPARALALGRIRGLLPSYPQVEALWRARGVCGGVTFERAG